MRAHAAEATARAVPLAERARVRLVDDGAASLSTAELIGLLWGATSRTSAPTATALAALGHWGGLDGLATVSAAELQQVGAIGPTRAARIVAAVELGRRVATAAPTRRRTVRGPRDVAEHLLVRIGRREQEELRVVLLDTRNGVIAIHMVYRGNVSAALVRVGELFRDAVRRQAARLILVHNHPSGDPTPSPDDLHLTAEAVAAGRLLDVTVLDHVILGHGRWVSLRDRGVAFDGG